MNGLVVVVLILVAVAGPAYALLVHEHERIHGPDPAATTRRHEREVAALRRIYQRTTGEQR